MPTEQEKTERIERYLSGEMAETERGNFEAALQQDATLAEALALHKALRQSLGNRQRRQLLDALADVMEQEKDRRAPVARLWLSPLRMSAAAAVLILVAAVGVWLYLRPPAKTSFIAKQPAFQPQPAPDTVGPATPPAPAGKSPEAGRLASADRRAFEPNRALDPLAGTLVRGENTALSVKKPENDAVFPLQNGKINFVMEGNAGEMTALTLRIYNNREADFTAGKTVYESEVLVRDRAFALKKSLQIPPGRYYAVLSAPGEEEPLTVLRFFAGSH